MHVPVMSGMSLLQVEGEKKRGGGGGIERGIREGEREREDGFK